MIEAARTRARRTLLRSFVGSPLAIAALLTGVLGTAVVDRALRSIAEADVIRVELERTAARIAAELAADDYVASAGARPRRTVDAGGGIVVETFVRRVGGSDAMRLSARVGEQQIDFVFAQLAGGTPPVLGKALAVAGGVQLPAQWRAGYEAAAEELPQLELPAAAAAEPLRLCAVDPGIALMRLSAGTDREDYVFAGADGAAWRAAATGVVVVDGNLWFDCGPPLELELDNDLTVVVRGNVYFGRSVRVRGSGFLTIVADGQREAAFFDRDGNGRWSPGDDAAAERFAGPVEGAGNVYIGAPREGQGRLDLDLGLVVGGVLHVAVDAALVHGPVVLHRGGMPLPGRTGALLATGKRLPPLERVALPGFHPYGAPRPGRLTELGREPLYPAGPAR